jgi:GDP-mannose 6-dehydrogenase
MTIAMFGLGYAGCVSAACLALRGHDVARVDVNPRKVDMVNGGTRRWSRPRLAELIRTPI